MGMAILMGLAVATALGAPTEPHPRLERTSIPGCGCAFYAPSGVKIDAPVTSEDGSLVWTVDTDLGDGFHAGVIAVKFKERLADGPAEERGALLESYLEFLKGQLNVVGAVGVGRGHTLDSEPSAVGVIDFWKDKAGDEWAIKGWVNPDRLAVMFIYGPRSYDLVTWKGLFFDGFRFADEAPASVPAKEP